MSKKALEILKNTFPEDIVATHSEHGDDTAIIKAEKLLEIMNFLKSDPNTDMRLLSDLTVVDYLPRRPRFEVVYHLHSLRLKQRIRIKIQVDGENLTADSVSPIWPAANWTEREAWDMFGIRFRNHPNLKRVLLYEEFEGHPLRKDYPMRKSQPRIELLQTERIGEKQYPPSFGIPLERD